MIEEYSGSGVSTGEPSTEMFREIERITSQKLEAAHFPLVKKKKK